MIEFVVGLVFGLAVGAILLGAREALARWNAVINPEELVTLEFYHKLLRKHFVATVVVRSGELPPDGMGTTHCTRLGMGRWVQLPLPGME
jgi:hypothetical protein